MSSDPRADAASDEIVLDIQGVSKIYRLYRRPQDRLKEGLLRRFGWEYGHDFHALHDVSFQLRRGDSLGILGQNGAGKSTLLQIIAGTLTPTAGRVEARGRVTALLELGSGFNPDFTGRENVRLNATILGFTPAEIEARFDDIAAFADIGEFLDQPIKVYSSGMLVRLAFAVQASLDPDILIVDEALAVGDVHFQHRCMRRIKTLVDGGTLLLYVSHATETVKRFCRRGLWLDGGRVRYFGEAGAAVEHYLAFMRMREVADWEAASLPTSAPAAVEDADARGESGLAQERLPEVVGAIDLADERLLQRGRWESIVAPGPDLGRCAVSREALAGFRCTAEEVVLRFARGPASTDAVVTIDGRPYHVPLAHAESSLHTARFELARGRHVILIAPAAPASGARTDGALAWLGGAVSLSSPLTFQRDDSLARYVGEVDRYGTGKARITAVELLDWTTLQPVTEARLGQRVRLRLHAERLRPAGPRVEFSFIVRDRNRIDLFGTTTIDQAVRLSPEGARFVVEFAFDIALGPGSYSILVSFVECSEDLRHRVPMDQIDMAKVFTVAFDDRRPVWYVFDAPVTTTAQVE